MMNELSHVADARLTSIGGHPGPPRNCGVGRGSPPLAPWCVSVTPLAEVQASCVLLGQRVRWTPPAGPAGASR